jgi:hypothetical protein
MLRAVPAPDTVQFDPAAAYPEVKTLRAALAARNWPAVRDVLDASPGPVARTMLIRFGADEDRTGTDGLEAFLLETADRDPEDAAAAAMLANHLINIGWEIRTAARAKNVSRQQFASFHDWLRRAEVVLFEAIARHPDDPALWTARLHSARGLGLGLAEARRRYDRLVAIDPHHLPGQTSFLQELCPKWRGSWELLHPWCREAMLAAPAGAPQGALVADGHLEHWAGLGGGEAGKTYLRNEPVRGEIHEAAERSVFHTEFRHEHGWVYAANHFAIVFSLIGDRPAMKTLFTMIGDFGLEHPWAYLPDGAASYYRFKRTVTTR